MIRAVVRKELIEVARNPGATLLLIAVSLVLFVLSQDFLQELPQFRSAIVDGGKCRSTNMLHTLVDQKPDLVEVAAAPEPGESYWEFMDRGGLQLVFECSTIRQSELWTLHASLRNVEERDRVAYIMQLFQVSLREGQPWYLIQQIGAAGKAAPKEGEAQVGFPDTFLEMAVRPGSVRSGSSWLMPGMGLLASFLLTFQLASSAVVRETSRSTWHLFRLGTHANAMRVVIAKSIVPIAIGIASVILYLVLGAAFGIGIKPETIPLVLAFCVPGIVAVAFQGLALSCLVRHEMGSLLASAAYLLGMLTLCGVLAPLAYSGQLVRLAGMPFPLTHVLPAAQATALHGTSSFYFMDELIVLGLVLAASALTALALMSMRLRRV